MIHAAQQTQFKFPFVLFKIFRLFKVLQFVEPVLQFAFLEFLFIRLFEPVLLFPRPESAFLFQLEQQTCL